MTTITAAKLREMAHTLGQRPEYALQVFISNFDTAIDDTPADTDETEAQEAAMQNDLEQRCVAAIGVTLRTMVERDTRAHCLTYAEEAAIARAIIPMVLEHAAKVVDGCAPNKNDNDLKSGWAYGVAKSAAAIRAIGASHERG